MSGQRNGSLRYWRASPQSVSPALTVTDWGLAAWADAGSATAHSSTEHRMDGLNIGRTMGVSRRHWPSAERERRGNKQVSRHRFEPRWSGARPCKLGT